MNNFRRGLQHGISIALGYLSVSFGFGIMAVQSGLTVWQAVLISLTNFTSAGQAAGVGLIAAQSSLAELFLAELVINIRYALMSLALSQKAGSGFRLPQRLLAACGITDEIFAVASVQEGAVQPAYVYGLALMPYLGWAGGTFFGAAMGAVLPEQLTNALGIALYGMFLAIIVPPARKSRGILAVVSAAALISVLLRIFAKWMTGGFAMIISAVIAAVVGALLFPVDTAQGEDAA